jgi:hypothetical protein
MNLIILTTLQFLPPHILHIWLLRVDPLLPHNQLLHNPCELHLWAKYPHNDNPWIVKYL